MTSICKKFIQAFMLSTLLFCTFTAQAQPERYQEGVHYIALDNPSSNNSREVMEVFWYGCSHCYAFEPLLENWQHNTTASMDFVRSPVTWNNTSKHHAQLYFVAEALGITSEIHSKIFDEIQQQGNYLLTENDAKDFFIRNGISGDDFDKAFKSFSVDSQLRQATAQQREIGVSSVPSMVVSGKYLVTVNSDVASHQEVINIVEYLLAQEES